MAWQRNVAKTMANSRNLQHITVNTVNTVNRCSAFG